MSYTWREKKKMMEKKGKYIGATPEEKVKSKEGRTDGATDSL